MCFVKSANWKNHIGPFEYNGPINNYSSYRVCRHCNCRFVLWIDYDGDIAKMRKCYMQNVTIEFKYNKGPVNVGIGYLKWKSIDKKIVPVLDGNFQCGDFILTKTDGDSYKFWTDEQDNEFITINGSDAVRLKAFVERGPARY